MAYFWDFSIDNQGKEYIARSFLCKGGWRWQNWTSYMLFMSNTWVMEKDKQECQDWRLTRLVRISPIIEGDCSGCRINSRVPPLFTLLHIFEPENRLSCHTSENYSQTLTWRNDYEKGSLYNKLDSVSSSALLYSITTGLDKQRGAFVCVAQPLSDTQMQIWTEKSNCQVSKLSPWVDKELLISTAAMAKDCI